MLSHDVLARVSRRAAAWFRHGAPLAGLAICLCIAGQSGLIASLDRRLSDARFGGFDRPATGEIVLVDIDAGSLAEVGIWPWPRHLYGDLMQAAARAGAARIAFDVDFSAASRPDEDAAFAQALATSGLETFLAAFVQTDPASGRTRASMPIEPLLSAAWPVSINVPVDADGRIRRFPWSMDIGGETVGSMPAVLADRQVDGGEFLIDHAIEAASIPRLSVADLLGGRLKDGSLAGKTLIVGATAIELHDLFPVPRAGIVSGSTVIALAAETLLQDRALSPWTPSVPLLAVLMGFGGWLVARVSLRSLLMVLLGAMVATEAVAIGFYVEFAVVAQTAALLGTFAALAVWGLLREFDLRKIRLWAAGIETRNTGRLLERVVVDGFDAVVIVQEGERIVRFNEAARVLLGWPETTQTGMAADLPDAVGSALRTASLEADETAERPIAERGMTRVPIDGTSRIVEYAVVPFWMERSHWRRGDATRTRYASITLRDVTDREEAQERLRHAALHDSLTDLPNRRALDTELDLMLGGDGPVTLMAFDLDRFKSVNDALGHATGDAVLREAARRVGAVLPGDARLFRLGGDEFLAVLRTADPVAARLVAERIVERIAQPFDVNGHRVGIGICIGLAGAGDARRDASVLRRQADVALYQAKRTGTGSIVWYDSVMDGTRLQRLALERDLVEAVEAETFELVYQPQARLSDGTWTGAEALLRWHHPERGFVSPAEFIPVAEEMGVIHELGAWVLRTACRDAQAWPASAKVAVNVSPIQLVAGDLVAAVRAALEGSGLDPRRLELEITESAFVGEDKRLAGTFSELLAMGVTFALDDFGTGYSSLGYLHRFPISKIKIDRSFVADLPGSRPSEAVLRSVVALADGLGLRVIAEGVETLAQAEWLRDMGCEEVQGYLYSRPLDRLRAVQTLSAGSFDPIGSRNDAHRRRAHG
ncbi:EAL domain-containing protein [Aureimonas jatrophae]|uniref:Diguanylate cyclase (GGDEF) domain-containing protein n=1 Tax=Aureimonas jatrophae TaxID=1166073 RepID=A0A1H0LST5_9HYPH|nr:EAL domain-containing protein [Aureimonas jatrophae]MBB3952726.1 diguanylate cyclase (GGDEF)-like protein [Aureimonas jatrophae]SDO71101.1 diguanylate cyclase (GGDEF) domain-containing protein [Aureimonas jatrophae]